MPVRLRRCRVGVRDNRVILLQFRMGRIAVVHIRHTRFGDCSAEGEEQDDGDETAEMHAVTAFGRWCALKRLVTSRRGQLTPLSLVGRLSQGNDPLILRHVDESFSCAPMRRRPRPSADTAALLL